MNAKSERAKDERILMALHLVEVEGLTNAKAGEAVGMTKNALIGIRNRINNECNAIYDLCRKPNHKDGGMPLMWWVR